MVQPQSGLDIQAAAVWYENQKVGLGSRFVEKPEFINQNRRACIRPNSLNQQRCDRCSLSRSLMLTRFCQFGGFQISKKVVGMEEVRAWFDK
jgi:hypothetical protein